MPLSRRRKYPATSRFADENIWQGGCVAASVAPAETRPLLDLVDGHLAGTFNSLHVPEAAEGRWYHYREG